MVLLLAAIAGCRKEVTDGESRLTIEWETDSIQAPWQLVTYGANSITMDTLEVDAKGVIIYDQVMDIDTIDLILLRDGNGHLQLPILPVREEHLSSARRLNGKLTLQGVISSEFIEQWHLMSDTLTGELKKFIYDHSDLSITVPIVFDALTRFQSDKESDLYHDFEEQLSRQRYTHSDIYNIMGIGMMADQISRRSSPIPYSFTISGQDKPKKLTDIIGKKELMAINVMQLMPSDSAAFARQKAYLTLLDSLAVPSYNVILNDTLPKPLKVKTKSPQRYFLVDSVGAAQTYLREQSIMELPTYILIDSLRVIRGIWHQPDSLTEYIKREEKKNKYGR